jgi:hypothetical protein
MATHENTKLCHFTRTSNSDFICTPIAPPAPATNFYEIKPALLNLVMKEQFSGDSTDDAAAHLNNFVELCEMQKYKDIQSDIRANYELDASSLDITRFALSAPSSKALKKSTLGR